jgi:hypothetical protein
MRLAMTLTGFEPTAAHHPVGLDRHKITRVGPQQVDDEDEDSDYDDDID